MLSLVAALAAAACLAAAPWTAAAIAADGGATVQATDGGGSSQPPVNTNPAGDPLPQGQQPSGDATPSQPPASSDAAASPSGGTPSGDDSASTPQGDNGGSGGSSPVRDGSGSEGKHAGGSSGSGSTDGGAANGGPAQPATSAPQTAGSESATTEPAIPPDSPMLPPSVTSIETGGMQPLTTGALACGLQLCWSGGGFGARLAGLLGRSAVIERLRQQRENQRDAARGPGLRLIAIALARDPITAQLLSMLGGGGGAPAAFLLFGLMAILAGLVLRMPDSTRAFRLPAVTWRPSVYVRPLELPG